jgi:hypothetical protein
MLKDVPVGPQSEVANFRRPIACAPHDFAIDDVTAANPGSHGHIKDRAGALSRPAKRLAQTGDIGIVPQDHPTPKLVGKPGFQRETIPPVNLVGCYGFAKIGIDRPPKADSRPDHIHLAKTSF